jgi:hypothetical protein
LRPNSRLTRGGPNGPNVAEAVDMSFTAVVDRVRSEFVEMPGMQLTLPQATRLWNLGADDCRSVIDALVDVGFLMWTPQRTVMRASRDVRVRLSARNTSAVVNNQRFDNSVGI